MLEIVLGVVAAALISMLIRFSLTVHRSRMENLRLHRDHFFERADRVVTNGRADDAMLLRIKSMALDIDSPRAFATLNEVVAGMLKEMRSGKSPPMFAFPRPSEAVCCAWLLRCAPASSARH
jgi:hypothetical protein